MDHPWYIIISNEFCKSRKSSLIWFLLMGIFVPNIQAGHVSGADLTYECMGSCTIRVHFKAYRNCSSTIPNISPVNTFSINVNQGCNIPVQLGSWNNVSNIEVTPVCAGIPTKCNSPAATLEGVSEHYWNADFDFCAANCNSYELVWSSCCRNQSISTIQNPSSVAIYTSTTVNPFLQPCNSSPRFNNVPVPYLCEGQTHIFSQSATDPDGDSLAYSLGPCRMASGQSVPYVPWINASDPLAPDWMVSIDSSNGDLTVSPDPGGINPGSSIVGVICVYVEEWRNGTLINTIIRDIQVTVIPCPPNDPPVCSGPQNIINGSRNGFSITTCVGANMCVEFPVADLDPGQFQEIWWNNPPSMQGAVFSDLNNPTITDTVSGTEPVARLCWTPLQAGTYSFVMTLKDNACPTFGMNQYNVTIQVNELQASIQNSIIGCVDADLCAVPSFVNPPLQFQWSGNGGIGNNPGVNDSCLTHTFPSSFTQYPVSLLISDGFGCTVTVTDTIFTHSNFTVNTGNDTSMCENSTCVSLSSTLNGNLSAYSYQWSPVAGINNPVSPNPCVAPDTTTTYTLIVTDLANGCTNDPLDPNSMVTVTVKPQPEVQTDPTHHICFGDTVQLEANVSGAGPMYDFEWYPASSLNNPYVKNPLAFPNTTTTYFLMANSNGCMSNITTTTVFVHPVPQVNAGGDIEICLGESTNLNATIAGDSSSGISFSWSQTAGLNDPFLEDPIATPSTTTIYTVIATSSWGCSSQPDSVTIFLRPTPIANAGKDITLCYGQNASLNGSYYYSTTDSVPDPGQIVYSWVPSAVSDPGIPDPVYSGDSSVWLYFSVAYGNCTTKDSIFVEAIPDLNAGIMADTFIICKNDSILLQATGGLGNSMYLWLPSTDISSGNSANTYFISDSSSVVTLFLTESGCKDSAKISLNVLALPELNIDHTPLQGCGPHPVGFMANTDASTFLVWDFGDGSQAMNSREIEHVFENPGVYPVQVSAFGNGNCKSDEEILVTVHPDPEVDIVTEPGLPALLYLPVAEFRLGNAGADGVSWYWEMENEFSLHGQDIGHSFTEEGNYFILHRVWNEFGCMSEMNIGPIIVTQGTVEIQNVFTPNGDGINDSFFVNYNGDQPYLLEIFDRWGNELFHTRNKTQGWNGREFGGNMVPEGVYFYSVTIGGKIYSGQVSLLK